MSNCTLFFQVSLDDAGKQTDPIYLYAQKQHLFAEGPDFLLSDALLYPQFSLVMKFMASLTSEAAAEAKFRQLMPKTCAWLDRVTGKELTENGMAFTENCQILASALSATVSFSVSSSLTSGYEKDDKCTEKSADTVVPIFHDLEWPPNVPNQSLYKSDPKRRNPNARAFTRQPDIDKAMAQVLDTLQVRKTRRYSLICL